MSTAARDHRQTRFSRYFTRNGWIHALLLLAAWLFFFPFFWMFSTSVKTDEELPEGRLLPEVPTYRASSPYVRPAIEPQRPSDVAPKRWAELLPDLLAEAAPRVRARQPHGEFQIDETERASSATSYLVSRAVGKLQKDFWAGAREALLRAFDLLLSDEEVDRALDASLAKMRLLQFQLRTLDVHIHTLTQGEGFADAWRVESGPAILVKSGGSTLLAYDFGKAYEPVILRYDFQLPDGASADNLHRLIFAIQADNSWHRVDAQLELAGTRWSSRRTTYLAQHRAMSFLFQPPTFDDQILRPRNWIPLRSDGAIADTGANRTATLRIIVSPSNTLQANWGKFIRNYVRAFDQVPFWRFFVNSATLVILSTIGALFSSAFVAYAFARLNWPGRGAAFLLLLSTMMLPDKVTMISSFMIWRWLGWYNTLNPLWVPSFLGSAFFIFLMTQNMRTIPRELEEAGRIDGLNPVQSWWYVILPNVKPTLAAIAILQFMASWNEFMGPLIYLRDQSKFPLALGLYGLKVDQAIVNAPDWTLLMAGNILMTVPVIVVFFLFQRYFVQGMTMTGMKG